MLLAQNISGNSLEINIENLRLRFVAHLMVLCLLQLDTDLFGAGSRQSQLTKSGGTGNR